MSNKSNFEKNKHGTSAKKAVNEIIKFCLSEGLIKVHIPEYRVGREGYDDDQFYCPFLIKFDDRDSWGIYSTTSPRDRIKENQWDSYNLKEIDSTISHCYLTYPSQCPEKELKAFAAARKNIVDGHHYSALSDIIINDELYTLIEKKALSSMSSAQYSDQRGKIFEHRVDLTLRYKENLDLWKSTEYTGEVGLFFPLFKQIMEGFGLSPSDVVSVDSKTNIPKLPSGGNAKTDVAVTVEYIDGSKKTFTISCKATNAESVSVSQFAYNEYSKAIAPNDENLKQCLYLFQQSGSQKVLEEKYGKEATMNLTNAIAPYQKQLAMFALGGHGGEYSDEIQLANYILTFDDNTLISSFHTLTDYCNELVGKSGMFGTPFQWTYQNERGKNIQLKTHVL